MFRYLIELVVLNNFYVPVGCNMVMSVCLANVTYFHMISQEALELGMVDLYQNKQIPH